jgi:hypothetical protein
MKTKTSLLQAGVLATLLCPLSLPAAVIFENLNTPSESGTVESAVWYGQSFVVGDTAATLTSAVLRMGDAYVSSGNFFVQLWDATGTYSNPGGFLTTLTGSADPSAAGDYTYTGSYSLLANTTYYIVAGVSTDVGQYRWSLEMPPSIESGSAIGYSVSPDAGTSWSAPYDLRAFNMQVNGDFTPVPEPGEWAGISVAVLGLVWLGKSWRERARAQAAKA